MHTDIAHLSKYTDFISLKSIIHCHTKLQGKENGRREKQSTKMGTVEGWMSKELLSGEDKEIRGESGVQKV